MRRRFKCSLRMNELCCLDMPLTVSPNNSDYASWCLGGHTFIVRSFFSLQSSSNVSSLCDSSPLPPLDLNIHPAAMPYPPTVPHNTVPIYVWNAPTMVTGAPEGTQTTRQPVEHDNMTRRAGSYVPPRPQRLSVPWSHTVARRSRPLRKSASHKTGRSPLRELKDLGNAGRRTQKTKLAHGVPRHPGI
ncbi:hypothetical protein BU23DRAFT_219130 [Bimuria novae-zelandiae CBS 107.79]|uniref:Uncharacterized protein n=1 Tax=Bimuria novae-zelandiae CBS 107.79 TaxID=1447943 RepID=A0A6A5UYB1_9PLEO|nr:hypothetical protein BU23DRAFT_219130 [Bimuria novae-zelandiae CBS 107.79]